MINVTKAYLPARQKYDSYVDDIFRRCWLTNNGPLLIELEKRLKAYLGVSNALMLNNGTTALQIAIKALALEGEIITTPFSYVATTSSIVWEQCRPVFVDIHPRTFNIDAALIEEAITPQTTAILATHVFGNACDIDAIEQIAARRHLKVVYDAAHAFGVSYKGKSILEYGDISTCSFHATKIFHTIEGGAVFTKDSELNRRMALLRNFGHTSPVTFDGAGINGKNSEFHAAMGLCVLDDMAEIMARRQKQWEYYASHMAGIGVQILELEKGVDRYNYSYFPIVLATEAVLLQTMTALQLQYIGTRRYFYPSLNQLDYVQQQPCPVSESISARVLCLPLFHDLTMEEQDMICGVVAKTI